MRQDRGARRQRLRRLRVRTRPTQQHAVAREEVPHPELPLLVHHGHYPHLDRLPHRPLRRDQGRTHREPPPPGYASSARLHFSRARQPATNLGRGPDSRRAPAPRRPARAEAHATLSGLVSAHGIDPAAADPHRWRRDGQSRGLPLRGRGRRWALVCRCRYADDGHSLLIFGSESDASLTPFVRTSLVHRIIIA